MTPERWQQVERIYQEAAGLSPSHRELFLDQACASDPDLRGEVDRMLSAEAGVTGFLETAAVGVAARALAAGTHIGPHEILSLLGTGGMGEVYKAYDTRLKRTVAIKVLPRYAAADEDRRKRLLREARTASALNHPNIVTIYDIMSENGQDCLVMEYVEGRTLQEVIGSKELPVSHALEHAIQIAGALAAAHSAGIIHRDLKACQCSGGEVWSEGPGFRSREARRQPKRARCISRHDADRRTRDRRHTRLHVARAGSRTSRRPPHRHLLSGHSLV